MRQSSANCYILTRKAFFSVIGPSLSPVNDSASTLLSCDQPADLPMLLYLTLTAGKVP